MSLTVRVDDKGLGLALKRMSSALKDMQPVFDEMGAVLERNVNLRFDTETAPDGSKWKPWAPSTAAARAKEGRGTLLRYTGRMRDSLTHVADSDSLEVGFGVPYAVYHEQLTPGKGRLPKRALLFDNGQLSDEDMNDALKVALRAFSKQLRLRNQ